MYYHEDKNKLSVEVIKRHTKKERERETNRQTENRQLNNRTIIKKIKSQEDGRQINRNIVCNLK